MSNVRYDQATGQLQYVSREGNRSGGGAQWSNVPMGGGGVVPVVVAESSTSKTSSKTCPSTAAATDTRGRVLVLAGRFGEWEAFKIP